MTDIHKISQEYMDFIFLGLDHGIDSIRDGGGPLVAFVMTKTDDQKNLTRLVTERLEDAPAEAEKMIKGLNPAPKLALIAYDGYATVNGERNDAIIVRSFDITEEQGIVFAQRYKPKETGHGIEPYGNAAMMGMEDNILHNNRNESTDAKPKKPWWKF